MTCAINIVIWINCEICENFLFWCNLIKIFREKTYVLDKFDSKNRDEENLELFTDAKTSSKAFARAHLSWLWKLAENTFHFSRGLLSQNRILIIGEVMKSS